MEQCYPFYLTYLHAIRMFRILQQKMSWKEACHVNACFPEKFKCFLINDVKSSNFCLWGGTFALTIDKKLQKQKQLLNSGTLLYTLIISPPSDHCLKQRTWKMLFALLFHSKLGIDKFVLFITRTINKCVIKRHQKLRMRNKTVKCLN